jgi:hypothetical protein
LGFLGPGLEAAQYTPKLFIFIVYLRWICWESKILRKAKPLGTRIKPKVALSSESY